MSDSFHFSESKALNQPLIDLCSQLVLEMWSTSARMALGAGGQASAETIGDQLPLL